MVAVGARGQIAAQPHRDRPGCDFRQPGNDHQFAGCGHRPCESRRQGERHGEPIRHADHDIANRCRRFKVRLRVQRSMHELNIIAC